ncbi:MAG: hypothetical protein D6701_11345, partial [Gemmatimonadetes bacterium]
MREAAIGDRERVLSIVRSVRRRWRTRVLLRGLAWVLAAGLAAFLISTVALERARFSPAAVLGLRWTLWTLVSVAALRWLAWPLARRVSDEQAALYLEEHEPSLEASVLAALDAARDPERAGTSQALAAGLVQSALERARAVDFGRRVDQRGLYRASGALAGLSFVTLALLLFGPASIRHGASALLVPGRDAAAVNPYAVTVEPGDVTIARGSDQWVRARLRGFESDVATVFVRSAGAGDFERLTMLPAEDGGFELLLLGLDEPTEYFVESEGVRSRVHRIDVADLPFVQAMTLEFRFPAYTGLRPRTVEDRGDIAALAGTRVHFTVTPSLPVAGGALVVGNERIELEPSEDGTWRGVLPVRAPGFYRIDLRTSDGIEVEASPEYTIDVLTDQPPSVSFTKPGRDASASAVEEVFLEARADDDYGIGALDLVYSVNGGPEDTVSLFRQRRSAPLAEVIAGHTLYLEEFELEAGDLVSYYAVARDNRTGGTSASVTSDIYFLQVRPFSVDFRQSDQAPPQGGGGGGMPERALSELQKQVVAATFNVLRDRETTPADDYDEDVVSVRLAQQRVREQVETLVERMRARGLTDAEPQFQRIAEMLPEAVEEMQAAEAALDARRPDEALAPEQRALLKLQKAEETYERFLTQQSPGAQGGGGGGANAEDLADLFELELDRLKNQYETVQRGERQQASEQVDETLERLKELARRQQQEAERQRRRASQSRAGGGGSAGQRDLAEETEEAARQLQRLARETGDAELERVAREMQEAAEAMRRAAAAGGSEGTAEATSALERLEEARRRLQRNRTDRLRDETEEARERAESLRREQEDIRRDLDRLQRGQVENPVEEARRLFDRKNRMVDELEQLEADLDRLSQESRQTQRDASDRLRDAANGIRDEQIKERVRYSRGLIQARDPEYTQAFEGEIERALESLEERIAGAAGAIGESDDDRRAEALDRARDLTRGVESLSRRLGERIDPDADTTDEAAGREGRRLGGGERGGERAGERAEGERSDERAGG